MQRAGKRLDLWGRELGRGKGGSECNGFGLGWEGWIEKFWIWGLLIQRKGEAKRVGLALLIGNAWLRTVLVSRC